ASAFGQDDAQAVMSFGVVRPKCECRPKMGNGFVRLPMRGQGLGEVVMCPCENRIDLERTLVMRDRFVGLSATSEQESEIVVGFGVGGLELEGLAILLERFIDASTACKHQSQVVARLRVIRLK